MYDRLQKIREGEKEGGDKFLSQIISRNNRSIHIYKCGSMWLIENYDSNYDLNNT